MLIQNPDPDGDGDSKDADSQTNQDSNMPSRNSSMKHRKVPVNKHMQNLQAFLITHMENLAALQMAMSTGSEMPAKRPNGEQTKEVNDANSDSRKRPVTSTGSATAHDADRRVEHGLSQQCHSVVVIVSRSGVQFKYTEKLISTSTVDRNGHFHIRLASTLAIYSGTY